MSTDSGAQNETQDKCGGDRETYERRARLKNKKLRMADYFFDAPPNLPVTTIATRIRKMLRPIGTIRGFAINETAI